jgi:hypothetical protein
LKPFNGANLEPFFLVQTIGGSKMEPHWNGDENDMEKEKRALSWREFVESGFDGREYQFPDFEGTFAATIACKRWNKSKNLLVYLDLDDGRKIITATWNKDNFFGLADMPAGTRVSVRFKTAVSTGKTYLNYAEQE